MVEMKIAARVETKVVKRVDLTADWMVVMRVHSTAEMTAH